jgi:hypothetical protein
MTRLRVLFLDADMLALRNIDHLLAGDWDISYVPERGHPLVEDSYSAFWTEEELSDFKFKIQAGLPPPLTGVNSGTLAVRAEIFHAVMAAWREIDEGSRKVDLGFRDQASWNALLMRRTTKGSFQASAFSFQQTPTKWTSQPFPPGEIQFPMYLDPDYHSYTEAALTHNCGGDTLVKIQFTFGLYMRTFFCDPTGLFFSILET